MPDQLAIELYGTIAATLRRRRGGSIMLRFTPDAIDRWGGHSAALSCSLPITTRELDATNWIDNLLPDNHALRAAIGQIHGVDGRDAFALIGRIGLDCAGAPRIATLDDLATPTTPTERELSTSELREAIRNLPRRPLATHELMRSSLGGAQAKLLLTRRDGRWFGPLNGAMSTHIIKPEPVDMNHGYAANEAYCMELARTLGLTPSHSEMTSIAGWDSFVIERHDRYIGDDGALHRLHQEDMCQAVGRDGALKYEQPGEHRLTDMARTIVGFASDAELHNLLRHVIFHIAIANTDAHDKNFSLIHHPDGRVTLAPIYDASATAATGGPHTLASNINGVTDIDAVTLDDIITEARRWKMRRPDSIALEFIDHLHEIVTDSRPDATVDFDVVELIKQRTTNLARASARISARQRGTTTTSTGRRGKTTTASTGSSFRSPTAGRRSRVQP